MAELAMSRSGSGPITTASRLAICLIFLGGGRRTESLRTHGISPAAGYKIFHDVVAAINKCPALEINGGNDMYSLEQRAAGFRSKSTRVCFHRNNDNTFCRS
jgi:hypothetical protein